MAQDQQSLQTSLRVQVAGSTLFDRLPYFEPMGTCRVSTGNAFTCMSAPQTFLSAWRRDALAASTRTMLQATAVSGHRHFTSDSKTSIALQLPPSQSDYQNTALNYQLSFHGLPRPEPGLMQALRQRSSASLRCSDPESTIPQSTPAFYCSKECLKQDWSSHKDACHAAQLEKVATKKLFRAGELLQEAFLATRAQVFDISIEKVQKLHESGRMIIFDGPSSDPGQISFSEDPEDRAALLSFNAGGDVFRRMMHEFGSKAFEGKSSIVTLNELC